MNDSTATAEILPFRFDTREVRTLLIDDQPWFFAIDVCGALHLSHTHKALLGLDDDEKREQEQYSGSGRKPLLINESGLYSLILRSRKKEAKRFKKWVTAEVLPAIRKHGHYQDVEGKMGTLIGQTIGTDGFHCLAAVVEGRLRRYPKATQQRARSHLWSQVRKAFGVSRGEDIPASQLDAARQFIAAYALEGEWLPASPDTLDKADQLNLQSLCSHMLQIRDLYRHYHLYDALTQLGSPAGKRLYGHVIDGAAIAQRYQSRFPSLLH
ncbi:hypothetical protein EI163_13680 [Halomonas sp. FME16]|uniref:Bro-N domain-containing protein n=1 Tax=Halomonas citrativorans TaxID=2742612 RepID=A0ABR9FDY3_9GAMM|nr:BRO family protein [Halomonas citrativorans]MBE0404591.1 hypothetical protein [Halomonas citrativorans]